MSRLDTFVAPRPNRTLIRAMGAVNRVAMLRGVPLLRSLWPLSLVPGLRGLADIRRIDWPRDDRERLAACCRPGEAAFIAPNHPEFFTDWMVDKEILSRTAPLAACWATHTIVNGMGSLAQRFWLANNLIAQIPGNAAEGRAHSVNWAVQGHGVLLHPEGAVGWHGDHVAPLLPGAVEMAIEALARGREEYPEFRSWVVPVVSKMVFMEDAERGLLREATYIEKRLDIPAPAAGLSAPERVFRIYQQLIGREEKSLGLSAANTLPFNVRHGLVVDAYAERLRAALDSTERDGDVLLRLARRALRERVTRDDASRLLRQTVDSMALARRLGSFAFTPKEITQEGMAEHLKRIRNDYCSGTLRDTLNRLVPRPVAPRIVHIRVGEPMALHNWQGSPQSAVDELRRRLQEGLDHLNAEPQVARAVRRYPNPFHARKPACTSA